MAEENISGLLKDTALGLGADFVGIVDSSCFDSPDYKGKNPRDVMPGVKSVIIIGVSVPKGAFSTLPLGRGEYTNTLMAGTATLRVISFQVAKFIEKSGYMATIAPSEGSEFGYWYADRKTLMADFSFKYAAYHAGLGNFGMNHLLITKEFGLKVRMMGILTDAPLEPDDKGELPFVNEACKDCMKCIDICPPKAITAEGVIHREKCADYMFNALGGLRCGMCIKVCPLDKF
ncbi:4Fe-4S ferredoxin iron-sulfur binding domain protein [Methanolacinia petrolearia DSM 11571]|uniref:4Fe-4S ferredoxin iron-sulfur binding domain protein n=1 Tax=Methanolacinia petrolearia (strain DSM 11571 / OCM 486 / SEBR 4847) TaxID=679926 RepID=E1RF50_METP4|nr:4Fe-4S dicluster domain-containing protein [Methanolacinia petrolearia]ADN37294.1 4Fe-4S ferredoxin iron-sulfur binding domain protein [Methanolacinia petrolearia DSM 11571]